DIVPDGTNSAASLPSRSATRSCRRLTVGSSCITSSPTSAAAMAARMPGVGRVTVSLRRSMIGSAIASSPKGQQAERAPCSSLLLSSCCFLVCLFHPMFHVPACPDQAEEDAAIGILLHSDAGRLLVDLPRAILLETTQDDKRGFIHARAR